MQALILAAGKGTRMYSERPKVLHEMFGRPILDYVLGTLSELGIRKPKVVIGYGSDQVRSFLNKRADAVLQREQRGTGHAVACAEKEFAGYQGDLLVWPGDMPLVQTDTLKSFISMHRQSSMEASVLSALRPDPAGYGRILRAGGNFYAIREELDATESERRIQEVNTGIYLFNTQSLFSALRNIRPENKKGEFYLTDTIEVMTRIGKRVEAFPLVLSEEGRGINSREDLAKAMKEMNCREARMHEQNGVTIVAPDQTFIAPGVKIGRNSVIYPWSYIEAGVKIGESCEIGPFAKIRKGSVIGDKAIVGSFVEVNRSKLGKNVMAKHLTYLGDAVIGEGTNIGAGTITANFDGKKKHKTQIGKKVLVGSDTVFVAPVKVADRARTGAGAVVTGGSKIKSGEVVVGIPARPLKRKKKS